MTTVLVAAASPVARAGLEAILQADGSVDVLVGVSGTSVVQQAENLQPDVVLLELERGAEHPAPQVLALAARLVHLPVVVLMDMPDARTVTETLRLGVRAVLPRESEAAEIVAAVRAASSGLLVLHPDSIEVLLPAMSLPTRSVDVQQESLTPREIEVLAMLAEGEGNKGIARRLGISEHTVKFHVGSILAKLEASSRTEAVTIGVRQGLIML